MSAFGMTVWRMMDNPQDWKMDEYRALHQPSGISFWISNGGLFFNGEGGFNHIGLFERHILWRKFTRMANKSCALKMQNSIAERAKEKSA